MNRRQLTDEERADAQRLSTAWRAYKAKNKGATQSWLAAESGIGTQGALGQYLRGAIPLNMPALVALCRVLEVAPEEISPRLAQPMRRLLDWAASPSLDHDRVSRVRRVLDTTSPTKSFVCTHGDWTKRISSETKNADDVFTRAWLNKNHLNASTFTHVIAPDDSMAPRIRSGDTLVVDTSNTKIEDDTVYVFLILLGEQKIVRIKRLLMRLDGQITVHCDNPAIPDEVVPPESLRPLGRVVALASTKI